jgi:hypothetical protein
MPQFPCRNVNLKLTNTGHQTVLAAGVPGFNPFQDYENYDFRTHHTNTDTRDHVKPEASVSRRSSWRRSPWQAAVLSQRLPRQQDPSFAARRERLLARACGNRPKSFSTSTAFSPIRRAT